MHCFGYEDLPKALNGAGVHSLDNVMTLDPSIHTLFDNLGLWFEALEGQENTYTIRARRGYHLKSCKANPITFRSTHPGLPLPNPIYLKIHASCCRIAHLSGAGEYMDKTLEDLEEMRVLSKDGTSAHLLAFALQLYGQDIILQPNMIPHETQLRDTYGGDVTVRSTSEELRNGKMGGKAPPVSA